MPDPKLLLRLKPGSEVSWGGASLGATQGVTLEFRREILPLENQRQAGPVDAVIHWTDAVVTVNLLEWTSTTVGWTSATTISTGSLVVSGETHNGTTHTWTFPRAYIQKIDPVELGREFGVVLKVTFHCLLNV